LHSRSDIAPSSPKRSGFDATTIVCTASGFFIASRLRARISAWLLSDAARGTQPATEDRSERDRDDGAGTHELSSLARRTNAVVSS
jgi:hypothetical protein